MQFALPARNASSRMSKMHIIIIRRLHGLTILKHRSHSLSSGPKLFSFSFVARKVDPRLISQHIILYTDSTFTGKFQPEKKKKNRATVRLR